MRLTRTAALSSLKGRVQQGLRRRGVEVTRFKSGTRAFEAHLLERHPPGAVLDVGANTGQFAGGLRALGFTGEVWSFEPGPEAFRVLEGRAFRDPHWHPVLTAVGRRAGTATLNVSANSVSSSLLDMERRHAEADPSSRTVTTVEVPVVTLDAWSAAVPVPGRLWLKVDTQGYEADVLAGAAGLLERVDVLRIELSLVPLYRSQPDFLQLLSQLRDRGFLLAHLDPGFEDRASHQLLQVDACLVRDTLAESLARSPR